MKIGVSSQNFRTITGHAGKGRRFIYYEIGTDGGVEEVDRLDLPKTMSLFETLPSSPHPLDELDVLITQSGGSGFLRKMEARGVKVVLTSATDPAEAVASYVRGEDLPEALPEEEHHHGRERKGERGHQHHDHDGEHCCGQGHEHGHSHGEGECCGGGGRHEHEHEHGHGHGHGRGEGGCCGGGGHHGQGHEHGHGHGSGRCCGGH